MKVLLANPPWMRTGWYGVRAGSRWPHMERAESPYMPFPFLLGYAAAVLEQDGVEVAVIDACAERLDRDAFVQRFTEEAPDVAFFEVSTPSLLGDLRTVAAVQEQGFDGDVILGGLHKPLFDGSFLAEHPNIAGTAVGEYEYSLRDFLRAGGRASGLKQPVAGLITRQGDGVLDGGRKASQTGLDDIPWPARHLFPMDRYHDLPGGIPGPSVQMWASRGCSFTCSFCAWPQILYGDHAYRTRDADAVVDEMLAMAEQGYASAYFDDDTFNLGKRRTAAIAEAFQRRGVSMPWAFMGRADTCDPKQYEALVATGLQAVKYGVESADTARLKQIGKNLDVQRVRDSISVVKSLGVKVHLTFMFGLPGETYDTMQRTLELAYELDPDSAQFTVATPFPGSRLHDELRDQGRLDGLEFEDLDGYRTGIVSTDALEAEQIVGFVHGIHRRWERRSRPAGEAPVIPRSEIGGSGVSVGILVRPGERAWLEQVLAAVVEQEGPSREIVIVAQPEDGLDEAAAAVCDWATWLDAEPGEPLAAMANRVPERCTGRWIALLHSGAVPRPGWLLSVVQACKADPDAGAFATTLHRGEPVWAGYAVGVDGSVSPASLEPFAAASCAAVYSRELLEDADGFDPSFTGELADADLALRGLLLGYRTGCIEGPGVSAGPELRLRSAGPDALRSRLRLRVQSLPREAWREAGPRLVWGLARELLQDPRGTPGLLRGLRELRRALDARRRQLGRRRVGPEYVLEALGTGSA